jgi:hypothetical protein
LLINLRTVRRTNEEHGAAKSIIHSTRRQQCSCRCRARRSRPSSTRRAGVGAARVHIDHTLRDPVWKRYRCSLQKEGAGALSSSIHIALACCRGLAG